MCVTGTDINKCFDRLEHESAGQAARVRGVPEWLWQAVRAEAVFGDIVFTPEVGVQSRGVQRTSGLPQGKVTSVLLIRWCILDALGPTEAVWHAEGRGICITEEARPGGGQRVTLQAYADNLFVVSRSVTEALQCCEDIRHAVRPAR